MKFFQKIAGMFRYLRFKPFDSITEIDRKQERHRRLALSSVCGISGQFVNYLVMILMVPLLIRHLGQEQYGLWLVISSLTTFVGFADLGLGNGLINTLGKAHGLQDRKLAREYVSSGFFILLGLALVLGVIAVVLLPRVDWSAFFHLTESCSRSHANRGIMFFSIIFLINLPVSIVQKIQMAYQENYINSIWLASGKILMLTGAASGVITDQSLFYFIVVLGATPVLMCYINAVIMLTKHKPWLRPSIKYLKMVSACELLRTGSFFFVTGFSSVISMQIDTLVIGRFLGAEQIPVYSIPLKLFMICPTFISFVLMPIWPAYREALVCGDIAWVKKTFWRTLCLTLTVILPASILLFFLSPSIVQLWIGTDLEIPRLLLGGFCIYTIMASVSGPMSMLLNGANIIGIRSFFSIIRGLFNLFLSVFLIQRIGIAGTVIATIFSHLIFTLNVSFYYLYKLFKKLPHEKITHSSE